jgi:hypothetical protein
VRLATGGTGRLPEGELPIELQNIFGEQASKLASRFLSICIRALDYCPPVDLELGEYLGALITADYDLVPDDRWAYREALIDAFRLRRIYPPYVTNLSEESLHPQQEAAQSAARFYMRRRRPLLETARRNHRAGAQRLQTAPSARVVHCRIPQVKGLAASGRANARSQNRLQLETVISLREMPPGPHSWEFIIL